MKLLIHQLKTEIYALRWALFIWAFLFAAICWLELTAWGYDSQVEQFGNRPTVPAEVINWIVALSIITLTLLANARDLFMDKRAPWITRPIPPITLYGAKALLVILTIIIPITSLICIVYPPISSWQFTAYFILEVWVWSLSFIAVCSLINLQQSWLLTLACFGLVALGFSALEKYTSFQFNETIEWWFSYTLILMSIVCALLYLALFKRNKNIPFGYGYIVCIALIAIATAPLKLPWYEARKPIQVAATQSHESLDKSAPVDIGETSGGLFKDGSQMPDRITFSYLLPMLETPKGVISNYVEPSDQLELTINGKPTQSDIIFTSLGLWDGHHEHIAANSIWADYKLINGFRGFGSTKFKVSIAIPDQQFMSELNPQEKLTTTDSKARIKGQVLVKNIACAEVLRSPLFESKEFQKDNLSVSWKPNKLGGKISIKMVNTDLMTGNSNTHKPSRQSPVVEVLIINHKRKECSQVYFTSKGSSGSEIVGISDANHIRFNAQVDLTELRERWNNGNYSHHSDENDQKAPDFDEWIKNCEIVAYQRIPVSDTKVDVDIELYLPQSIVDYLEKKGQH